MLMFSWPPASTVAASPQRIACAASPTALRPLPHTLLIVSAGTSWGSPASMDACRAGFWPAAAASTWPMMTSSTSLGSIPVSSIRAAITLAPSPLAGIAASEPPNFPTAVRRAATMTASFMENLPRARVRLADSPSAA